MGDVELVYPRSPASRKLTTGIAEPSEITSPIHPRSWSPSHRGVRQRLRTPLVGCRPSRRKQVLAHHLVTGTEKF